MRRILKYPLKLVDEQVIEMNSGSILCVQMQGDVPTIWARIDEALPKRKMIVHIIGTGHDADRSNYCFHVGTVQHEGFVWHVFAKEQL